MSDDLPAISEKTSLHDWLESLLPFKLPHIPLVQTAKNLDLALARIVGASSSNLAARIDRSTAIVAAKSGAETSAINAASEIAAQQIKQNSPFASRALDYAFNESILAQKNREEIGAKAADELDQNPPTTDADKEIDPDWLNQFASFAEKISSEDLQSLWAKILAGEIRNPGSIRLRTLQQLSVISRDEAEMMHTLLAYAISYFIYKDGLKNEFSLRDILACEHLGLLSGAEGMLSVTFRFTAGEEARYQSHDKGIRILPEKDITINVPAYPLSAFSSDLLGIAQNLSSKVEYLKSFAQFMKSATGGKVFIADLVLVDPIRQTYNVTGEIEI